MTIVTSGPTTASVSSKGRWTRWREKRNSEWIGTTKVSEGHGCSETGRASHPRLHLYLAICNSNTKLPIMLKVMILRADFNRKML